MGTLFQLCWAAQFGGFYCIVSERRLISSDDYIILDRLTITTVLCSLQALI